MLVIVDASFVPLTWANADDVVGSFEQMNLNTQAQSVRLWLCGVDAQLFLVSTTSAARNSFEVVVASGRSATTTSWMLEAGFVSDVVNSRLSMVMTPSGFVSL